MAKKIYLSGKITGDEGFAERFSKTADRLSADGDMVFNPAVHPDMFTHGQFMQIDLLALSFCDTIYLMDNWRSSKGAKMEFDQARILGLNLEFEEPLYQIKDKAGMFWNSETKDFDLTFEDLDGTSLYTKEEVDNFNSIFFNGFASDNIISTDKLFPAKEKSIEINHTINTEEKEKTSGVELIEQTSYKFRLEMEDGTKTPWQYYGKKPTEEDYADVKKYYTNLNKKKIEKAEKKIDEDLKLSTVTPKKTAIGYKAFYLKDGKLYPPMVRNPDGKETPMGLWLKASTPKSIPYIDAPGTRIECGGEGTYCNKTYIPFRPGFHIEQIPYEKQFEKINPLNNNKELFPSEFVWCEVEYSCDTDYQNEADNKGVDSALQHLPENGFYRYKHGNEADVLDWIVAGKMKVNRILSNKEIDELCNKAGIKPQKREADYLKEINEYLSTPPRLRPVYDRQPKNTSSGIKHTLEEKNKGKLSNTKLDEMSSFSYSH